MELNETGILLRIFIGENDKIHGKPLYEQIVLKAREINLAGATVLRGLMGFGAGSRIHSQKILRLSEDLPILIEIVDKEEKIASFLPYLQEVVGDGMITTERVNIIKYFATKK